MVDRTASLCLAGWLAATAATAQAPQGAEALRRDRERSLFELEFRVTGSYIYNFFQAPNELPELNVPAGNGELRVTLPLADRRARVFLRAGGSLYHELAPSAALAGGGSWTAGPRRLDAIAGFRWRNPRIEGGDQVGSADLVYFSGSYSVRPVPQLELSGLVDYYRATYSSLTSRNHHAFDAGGAVRYRGLGYQFMPEAGAALGRLDARVDSEDYEQDTFWIGASSIPVVGTYFSTRYRHRRRRYPVLGREDTRHQLTITAELGLASRWSWLLYSSFEDARSSNADRTFTTQLIVTGLAYRF